MNTTVIETTSSRSRLVTRPLPDPASDEMTVSVRAVGLCGTDLHKIRFATLDRPAVLGHEVVGIITTAGTDVARILPTLPGATARRWGVRGEPVDCIPVPGERVVVTHHVACRECDVCARDEEPLCPRFRENLLRPGGFASTITVGARAARSSWPVPAELSDEAAIFVEPAACAIRGIERALSQRTANPVPLFGIVGAGSMGMLHVMLLRIAWPGAVIGVIDGRSERLKRALETGADFVASPEAAVDAFRSKGPVADAVFDTAGGSSALATSLAIAGAGGTVVLFAHAAEGERHPLDVNALFKSEQRIVATYSSGLLNQRVAWDLIRERRLRPESLVTDRLPLSSFDEGVRRASSHEALKVLFLPESEA